MSTAPPVTGYRVDDDTAAIKAMLSRITAKQRRQVRKLLESMVEG